ncbi:L-threonylcarbamoyladenylate synthase [Limnoraphis robusta Tam1]|uniref:L-threonylcarbamoyladenylate synthase n=1 Tax=Limnoraphis robusta CCNP1315 TaxID=3110306 RepID=A0ABU5U6P8_9CYAN|nr:L-threonylcarbamoyladenylate synthase [Limnoraphis robusta]MEA5496513.1 L-threonylcarbamoyladenylate synthase [Limnoraphis robusta BA-68 BA1]MEA5522537.1 L-threonylcarbamoyladenylate synthase [Limnoraphis robusta CCNP1315]MEA5539776.1 L-threonylcarbamoyladenylate synthase [Limnoraphis robusta Tam1]MEA5548280.1 L-threonylcarbamoyladenylate synthase [Limnoraphis robusta CCNP1324]
MATYYEVHPQNPQERAITKVIADLRSGAVMLYPTDTVYAIGCDLNVKSAVERVRQIKQLSNDKPLTFLCSSLSNISNYAIVSDQAYRIIKRLIPGSYTFLLPATKLVPRLVMSPKRKTTGIRVPDNNFCLTLIEKLGNPIISTSAHITNEEEGEAPVSLEMTRNLGKAELFDSLEKLVDIIVDDTSDPGYQVSTILDLTEDEPILVRQGKGWEAVERWVKES